VQFHKHGLFENFVKFLQIVLQSILFRRIRELS